MRRYAFYIAIALLAFGIGLFVVFQRYRQTNIPVLVIENTEKTEDSLTLIQKEEVKYECKEKELELFWDKLDKEGFLKFTKAQLKENYKHYPSVFESEWKSLSERFNCKYFKNLESKDLNNDGKEEIFVRGDNLTIRGDKDLFVFRETNGKWQLILFNLTGREIKIAKRNYEEYPQITVKSEYFNTGGRRINSFRFDGESYKCVKCILEYEWQTDVKGKIINYRKPLIEPCD